MKSSLKYEEVIITEDYYTSNNHITYSKNRQSNNHKIQDNTNGPITHPTKYKDKTTINIKKF